MNGRGLIVRPAGSPVDRRPITADLLGLRQSATGAFKINAWEKLYSVVEPDLVRCTVRGDLKINESDAASLYGVGRTVMHEVLLLAQANGLVPRDERSRWRTVPLDDEQISDLYALRRLLELETLASTAGAVPEAKLSQLITDLEHATKHIQTCSMTWETSFMCAVSDNAQTRKSMRRCVCRTVSTLPVSIWWETR